MMNRRFGPLSWALLAAGITLVAVGAWMNLSTRQTPARLGGAIVLTVLAGAVAYRAWSASRAR
jgi:hypothetical protein